MSAWPRAGAGVRVRLRIGSGLGLGLGLGCCGVRPEEGGIGLGLGLVRLEEGGEAAEARADVVQHRVRAHRLGGWRAMGGWRLEAGAIGDLGQRGTSEAPGRRQLGVCTRAPGKATSEAAGSHAARARCRPIGRPQARTAAAKGCRGQHWDCCGQQGV